MRDLDTILKNIKTFYYNESFIAVCDERNGMLSFPLGVVYEAIERALKAEDCMERRQEACMLWVEKCNNLEAEVERLKLLNQQLLDYIAPKEGCNCYGCENARKVMGDLGADQAEKDKVGPPNWCPAKEKEWGPDHCVGKDPNCELCKLDNEEEV